MNLDPEVTYEIWSERSGKTWRRNLTGHLLSTATAAVDQFNREEALNARMEHRPIRTRFFVVKATTTFEEIKEASS